MSSLGTSDIPDEVLTKAVREVFDLRPYHITKRLDLLRPIYKKTSCYGHFGRELPEFTWEHTDAAADLRTAREGLSAVRTVILSERSFLSVKLSA